MNDKELSLMAENVDLFLIELVNKYRLSPLSASSVILARCLIMVKAVHAEEDFSIILAKCQAELLDQPKENTIH